MIENILSHISHLTVGAEHTAMAVGSGDLEVLSTPIMIALMENAAMHAVAQQLPPGHTTVGAYIEVSHLRPTPLDVEITASATVDRIEGKKIYFSLSAKQGDTTIGVGKHMRVIVEAEKFLPAKAK